VRTCSRVYAPSPPHPNLTGPELGGSVFVAAPFARTRLRAVSPAVSKAKPRIAIGKKIPLSLHTLARFTLHTDRSGSRASSIRSDSNPLAQTPATRLIGQAVGFVSMLGKIARLLPYLRLSRLAKEGKQRFSRLVGNDDHAALCVPTILIPMFNGLMTQGDCTGIYL